VFPVGDEDYFSFRQNVVKALIDFSDVNEVTTSLYYHLKDIRSFTELFNFIDAVERDGFIKVGDDVVSVRNVDRVNTYPNPYILNILDITGIETKYDEYYAIIFVHMGGDVRTNYAGPIVAYFPNEDWLFSFFDAVGTISFVGCPHAEIFTLHVSIEDGMLNARVDKREDVLREIHDAIGYSENDAIFKILSVKNGKAYCKICGKEVEMITNTSY